MKVQRFFYNRETEKIIFCDYDHASFYHNHKGELGASFDEFIRGILKEGELFLRVFYPYKGIENLSFNELIAESNKILGYYKADILKALRREGVEVNKVFLSVTNEELKSALNSLYV